MYRQFLVKKGFLALEMLDVSPRMDTFVMSSVSCIREHAREKDCHFQIAWTINPHMVPGSTEVDHAEEQHRLLKRELRAAGAEVLEVPFVCEAYDSVFVKDNAFLFQAQEKLHALMAQPFYPERKSEQDARLRMLERRGFLPCVPSSSARFEGGDLVAAPGGVFLGHGFRSEPEAAMALSRRLSVEVVPLELVDPHLYHLDTALAVLTDGTAVACREAFSPRSWECIMKSPWIRQVVEVPRDEALRFGCNLVQVGETVILGGFYFVLMKSLRHLGFQPRSVPLSQFQHAGGSAACLVSRVHDLDRIALGLGLGEDSGAESALGSCA